MNKIVFCLVSVLSFLFIQKTFGEVDPQIQWETLLTSHFEVIYDARHYQTARQYALRLELNHKLLSSYFKESPERTVVIINDSTDLANGYATRIPYPHIMIYPVLPVAHDTISEYSDWPHELSLHEYTHILNFEPAHGFMKFLRYTVGSIITPTMLLPRWWHEGVAVEMETRFSSHGRLRSNYQDAVLRALAKENQFGMYSVADINETEIESWPRGARPYLFGSVLMSEIQAQKGGTISDSLLQSYSGRLPYLVNGPAEDNTGKDFEGLFSDAINTVKNKTQQQLEILRQMPTTSFSPLPTKYLESHSPQLSPNGRFLTLVGKNLWGKSSIQIFDRHEEKRIFDLSKDTFSEFLSIDNKSENTSKDAPPAGNINRVAWLPDSTGFVFDQIRYIDAYHNYSDLFFYDLNLKKNRRVTTGARLREPGMAPSGAVIAAIQLEQSNTKLITVNLDGSQLKVVYTPPLLHKVSNPLFSDEQNLLFVERDMKGNNSLKAVNLTTLQITPISTDHLRLQQIESLNRESSGISFVAQEKGVQNFYVTKDQFKTVQRLTQTETAVFDGAIDTRLGLIYNTIMSHQGLVVTSTDLPIEPLKAMTTPVEPLFADRYGSLKFEMPSDDALEKEFGPQLQERHPYSPLKHMVPTYWLPFIYFTENGYGTQVSTAIFDPLEKHAYALQAGYDSFAKESAVGASYGNATTTWPFTLTVSSQQRNQPYLNYRYDSQQINFMASHDLRPWNENTSLGFGVEGNMTTTSNVKKRLGPQLLVTYDKAAKSMYSEIPFAGYQIALYANHYVKTDQLSSMSRGLLNFNYFHSQYLPERHIALINLKSLLIDGEIGISDLAQSDSYHLAQNFNSARFALRGYDPGYFYFKSAQSAAFEYHLPLSGYKGWGTLPLFLKHSRMNFFAEALAVDGIFLDYTMKDYVFAPRNKAYTSYGVEFKGDITLGYYFPVTCVFGIYRRPDYSGPSKTSTFIGFQI